MIDYFELSNAYPILRTDDEFSGKYSAHGVFIVRPLLTQINHSCTLEHVALATPTSHSQLSHARSPRKRAPCPTTTKATDDDDERVASDGWKSSKARAHVAPLLEMLGRFFLNAVIPGSHFSLGDGSRNLEASFS